jgi:hypothetical protein
MPFTHPLYRILKKNCVSPFKCVSNSAYTIAREHTAIHHDAANIATSVSSDDDEYQVQVRCKILLQYVHEKRNENKV